MLERTVFLRNLSELRLFESYTFLALSFIEVWLPYVLLELETTAGMECVSVCMCGCVCRVSSCEAEDITEGCIVSGEASYGVSCLTGLKLLVCIRLDLLISKLSHCLAEGLEKWTFHLKSSFSRSCVSLNPLGVFTSTMCCSPSCGLGSG